jgi:vancomycin permeability regulator SanA
MNDKWKWVNTMIQAEDLQQELYQSVARQRHMERERLRKEKRRQRRGKIIKRIMWIITVGIVFCIAIIIGANVLMVQKYKDKILTQDECGGMEADCIMILGAMVYADGTPCHMLEDRLQQGIDLYIAGASNRLLMTGDHGQEDYDEVNAMKQYAIDAGIESDNIFMDHAGFSTYDSMYRAKKVFGVKKMIIVTQRYHMARALYIANKLGIDAYGVCAEDITYSGQTLRDIREVAARAKDIFTVLFNVQPKYLGEEIPISGSGAATDDK